MCFLIQSDAFYVILQTFYLQPYILNILSEYEVSVLSDDFIPVSVPTPAESPGCSCQKLHTPDNYIPALSTGVSVPPPHEGIKNVFMLIFVLNYLINTLYSSFDHFVTLHFINNTNREWVTKSSFQMNNTFYVNQLWRFWF